MFADLTHPSAGHVTVNPRTGLVLRMDNWAAADGMVADGTARRVDGGPATYGDTFFYINSDG